MRKTRSRLCGRTLRRASAVVVVAGLALAGPVAPASAEEIAVSGELEIHGQLGVCGSPPTGLRLTVDGSGTLTGLGEVDAHVEFCIEHVGPTPSRPYAPFDVVSGSFSLTTDRGTVSGDVVGGYSPNPTRLVLDVTGGTGDFVGATGSLQFDGETEPAPALFVWRGPITGTIDVPDRPESPDDCRDGGWRDLVDDTGRPFANQGLCVAWVVAPPGLPAAGG